MLAHEEALVGSTQHIPHDPRPRLLRMMQDLAQRVGRLLAGAHAPECG